MEFKLVCMFRQLCLLSRVHGETLWMVKERFGIPPKLVEMVIRWYNKCAVADGAGQCKGLVV